jgi:hypothetical protein
MNSKHHRFQRKKRAAPGRAAPGSPPVGAFLANAPKNQEFFRKKNPKTKKKYLRLETKKSNRKRPNQIHRTE